MSETSQMSGVQQELNLHLKQIQLRRATVADAVAIAQIRIDCWRNSYRGVIPDSYLDNMNLEESVTHWRTIFDALATAGDRVCVFVAESEGKVVGFASAMLLPEIKCGVQAELSAIYLLPEWQRCGIGRKMLQKIARLLQAQGCHDLLVWVLSENSIGRNFFEELGAQFLKEQDYTWDGIDAKEVAYAWADLSVLLASATSMPSPNLLQ